MSDNQEEEEEKPMCTLEKGESVYSYAIFLPPIIYHKQGTLHNYDMCLGIILLIMNLFMQVGMTYIVGQGVLVEGNEWRTTLVGMDASDQIEEGQVGKDLDQMSLGQLGAIGIGTWGGDNDHFEHMLDEAEMELGFHHRNHHRSQVALIEELESEASNEEATINRFKNHGLKNTGSLRASKSPEGLDGGVHLMAAGAGKPRKGGKGAAKTYCRMDNATYSCLAPSTRYASRWELLDLNGDGIWTREEAMSKEVLYLKKQLKALPFLVFRAITVGLVDRQPMDPNLWVDPNGMVAKMEGIPKAYFDYWMGDAALCSFADPYMCPTLLNRGFFNGAMNPKHRGKDIQNIDGALDYCDFMLKVGGGCDQSLPQIYKLYRAKKEEQCGAGKLYPIGLYKNPHSDVDKVFIVGQAYSNIAKHLKGDTMTFQCFLFLVLLLWLYALSNEIKEMIKLAEFTMTFPAAEGDLGLEVEKDEEGNETYTLTGISSEHRKVIGFMCVTRVIVLFYLGGVGLIFLVNDVGYMDLLMNAVALAFVLEVDEILFGSIARSSTMDDLESLNDVEFETHLPTEGCIGWMLEKDFWGVVLYPLIAYGLILCQSLFVTKPVLDALNCGCYQLGSQCRPAHYYDEDWWNNYWSTVLPSAMAKIAEYKGAAGL